MNAILCEDYEAPVLTNEAIEVHLTYLRSGFDAVQAALPVLRDRVDLLSAKVDSKIEATVAKIEAVHTSLGEKIDKANEQRIAGGVVLGEKIDKASEQRAAGDAELSVKIGALDISLSSKIGMANEQRIAGDAVLGEKIDKASEQRAAGDAALGVKIERLTEKVLEVQSHQKAVLWWISTLGIIVSAVSIAHTFDWI